MISGVDFILNESWGPDSLDMFTSKLKLKWPHMVIEPENTKERIVEYFFFESPEARDSWEISGLTVYNKGQMIHLIIGQDTTTIVFDDSSGLRQHLEHIIKGTDNEN